MPEDLTRLSATQVLHRLRQGHLTVEAYARALLARIRTRDPVVQAWSYLDPELVIAQARKLDQTPLEKRGPLHGVAIGIKDVALTQDMPTRYNSDIYRDSTQSAVDAATVTVLRAAGALILGKTATTEFAATTVGGPCRNPHHPEHTPGGSSSGSAAAVADFQVPLALGTQTGGSTIRPASYNGIYGFKPTWGAISREGLCQFSITCDTPGFFARTVEDLDLLADVFQLADDEPLPESPFTVNGARIAFARTHLWPDIAGPGLQAAWEKAKSLLTQRGATVEEVDLPGEFEKLTQWHANVTAGEARSAFLGHYLLSKDKLHPSLISHVENERRLSNKEFLESLDGCARLRPVWDEFASQYDVVIAPSMTDEAPHGLEFTGDQRFCAIWTILHAPTLNVPGFAGEKNGLPIGLTIVGPRYHDRRVLYAGRTIGEIFTSEGGFVSKI